MAPRMKRRKNPKGNSYLSNVSVITGLMIIFISSFLYFYLNGKPKSFQLVNKNRDEFNQIVMSKLPPPIKNIWIKSFQTIKEYIWLDDGKDFEKIFSLNMPLKVINNKIKNDWPIFSWDLNDNLLRNLTLSNTRVQFDPVFILSHERDKGGMLGSAHDNLIFYEDVTIDLFLKSMFSRDRYLYWTGDLEDWEKVLGKATQSKGSNKEGWRKYYLKEPSIKIGNSTKEDIGSTIRPILWLSHPGVVSQMHFDTQHNMFIQLMGKKKFILFPPESEIYQYPNIHRSYRQSQLSLENDPIPENFPLLFDVKNNISKFENIIEVSLLPGDTLYIPPYWAHRVESHTLTLSLSVLSPSLLEATAAEIFWQPVPFGQFQFSQMAKEKAASFHLKTLFKRLIDNPEFNSFNLTSISQKILETRFKLYESNRKVNRNVNLHCHEENLAITSNLNSSKFKFEKSVQNIVLLLSQLNVHTSVKINILSDYIEQIARWAVGPLKTSSFLLQCI